MSRFTIVVCLVLSFGSVLFAQDEGPLFGPEPKKEDPQAKGTAPKKAEAEKPKNPDQILIEKLSAWPTTDAHSTARELVLKGARVVPLLIENLENNDWRIRCGCAYVLGELKEQVAFAPLQKAIRDIANRISLGPLFQAMTKIEPVLATSEILPFVASTESRTAKAAIAALPEVIDQKFAPRIIAMTNHRDNSVRFRALSLLPKLYEPISSDVYIRLLNDRAPRVAATAADILSKSRDEEVYKKLQDLVISGSIRSGSYATIALVKAEDRTSRVLLDESNGPLKKRLLRMLNLRSDLPNCAAAIALANMSMRSHDEGLRKFANTAMLDFLLDAAATGKIFKDYISVKDLCLQKAALITGESFGNNARAWVDWWIANREGFVAKRQLTSIAIADAKKVRLRFARRRDEDAVHLEFLAGEPGGDKILGGRPTYLETQEMEALVAKIRDDKIMSGQGMKLDPGWVGNYVELTIILGNSEYRRAHYGSEPQDLLDLGMEMQKLFDQNKWQLFWDRARIPDFQTWFRQAKGKFTRLTGDARTEALADDALQVYTQLDPRARRAAAQVFLAAGNDWINENKGRFLALLNSKTMTLHSARVVLDTLAQVGGHDVLAGIVDYLPLFRDDGALALRRYISRRPLREVLSFDDGGRPNLRVALIPFLAEKMGDDERVLDKLLGFMSDGDPRVTRSLVASLRGSSNDAMVMALESRIEKASAQEQLGLVELLGAIGGEEVVGRLSSLFDQGSQPLKVSVINALKKASGEKACAFLLKIAKDGESEFYRIQALTALADIGGEVVLNGVRKMLASPMTSERLRESMNICTRIFRASLDRDFVPFLKHEDAAIRKEAALLLGPLAIKAAVPELMNLLLDETESNRAWEYLELITCHEVVTPGGEEALEAFRKWFDEHKGEKQHEWFMAAMRAEKLPAQYMLGFLEGKTRPLRTVSLLIRALGSEKWFVRVNAVNYLARIRGAQLGRLDRRSSPAEIEKVRTRWSEWYKILVEGF